MGFLWLTTANHTPPAPRAGTSTRTDSADVGSSPGHPPPERMTTLEMHLQTEQPAARRRSPGNPHLDTPRKGGGTVKIDTTPAWVLAGIALAAVLIQPLMEWKWGP